MKSTLKIVMVEYLNTRPFVEALNASPHCAKWHLQFLNPKACGEAFDRGEADVALIPSYTYLSTLKGDLFADFGIGCNGPVRTVGVFSEQPFVELNEIILDSHSSTSVNLLKMLLSQYWEKSISLIEESNFEGRLEKNQGVLMIGDKVFENEGRFEIFTDLGEEWSKFSGLPFLFAVWVCKKGTPKEALEILNSAFVNYFKSIELNLDSIVRTMDVKVKNLKNYFLDNLVYSIDDNMIKGFSRFREFSN